MYCSRIPWSILLSEAKRKTLKVVVARLQADSYVQFENITVKSVVDGAISDLSMLGRGNYLTLIAIPT